MFNKEKGREMINKEDKKEGNIDIESLDVLSDLPSPTFSDLKLTRKQKFQLFWSNKSPRTNERKKDFFFWNPPGRSDYEKRLVFKLDCIILSYCCLSFFVKYLDQSNVNNAYVSGMKEALSMEGNMFNWLNQSFLLSYGICGIFGSLLITKISPHIVLPLFEVIWSVLCLLVITCDTFPKLVGIRTLQGAFAGIVYPACHYILGSWYTPAELNTRTAIFIASGSLGTMFGGYIQSGIHRSLDGKGGLPGWKWIFVIDFIITIPVAAFGFFVLPGEPSKPRKSIFLKEHDFEFCRKRIQVVENVEKVNRFDFSVIKRAILSWQLYVFVTAYILSQLTEECTNYWNIVLETQGFNIYDRNNFPTVQSAVKVISSLISGFYCDIRGKRYEIYAVICIFWITGLSILVKYDVPFGAQFYGNSVLGVCAAYSVVIVSWANEMCKEDDQLRATVLGCLNLIFVAVDVPYATQVFNTDNAPRFKLGMTIGLTFCCFLFFFNGIIVMFDRYQNRLRDLFDDKFNKFIKVEKSDQDNE